MPIFQELDAEIVLKMLEGYENELEPEQKGLDAFYRQFRCPRCKGPCLKHFLSTDHAFGGETAVPRSGLKCTLCDCVFDPHTGLIVSLGNLGNIPARVGASLTPYVGGEEDD
jgi:hypothetical protein